jgi:integrase
MRRNTCCISLRSGAANASTTHHFCYPSVIPIEKYTIMASYKFNDKWLASLKGADVRQQFSDTLERGLRLRVSPGGGISFQYQGRKLDGKLSTVTLGHYPDISLRRARELAAGARIELKSGIDVNGVKRSRRFSENTGAEDATLGDILTEYEAEFAPRKKTWSIAGPRSTRSTARRCIEAVYEPLLANRVSELTPSDLAKAMKAYTPRSGKTSANGQISRARAYLSPVLDWAAGRGKFVRAGAGRAAQITTPDARETHDPAPDDPKIRGERDRVLNEEELKLIIPLLVYPAPAILGARVDPKADFRPIMLRFILLTAARLDEVVQMRRRDLDKPNRVWVKPSVKSTRGGPRGQSLPLSSAAFDLLTELPHFNRLSDDDLVFPNTNGRPIGNWDRFQDLIDRASGTTGWHRHDLRRTAATLMVAVEVPLSTIDRILGHSDPLKRENVSGAASTYMRFTKIITGRSDPQAAALDALSSALFTICFGSN